MNHSKLDPQKVQKSFNIFQKLLGESCYLQDFMRHSKENVREKFKMEEKDAEFNLRVLLDGNLSLLTKELEQRIKSSNMKISYQLGIITSFIRTHFIISDMILDGDLLEALTLMRKQLESLARLHEIDLKPLEKILEKTPNIGVVNGSGRLYSNLSEVAHFSTPRVAELLGSVENDQLLGPSLLSIYSEKSGACFDTHCFIVINFLAWLLNKVSIWYPESDYTENGVLLINALDIATDLKIINVQSDIPDPTK